MCRCESAIAAIDAMWGQCGAARNDGEQRDERRRPCKHRFSPYDAEPKKWPTSIEASVRKALQSEHNCSTCERPWQAPMMRRRRLLAAKMRLATQSVGNMATYLEQHAAFRRTQSVIAPPEGESVDGREVQDGNGGDDYTICCICLEKNQPNGTDTPVEALRCGHVFHRDCISQWMNHRRCCPVDRLPLEKSANEDA